MKTVTQHFVFVILVLLFALVGTGCSSMNYKLKCRPVESYPMAAPIDASVLLVLEDEFAGGVVYTQQRFGPRDINFSAPGSLNVSAESLTRALFSKVQVISGPSDKVPTACDAVITPRVVKVVEASDLKGGLTMFIEWTVVRPNGELIWKKTVKGEGVGGVMVKTVFQKALNDAFRRSYEQMFTSPEIRAITSKKQKEVTQ